MSVVSDRRHLNHKHHVVFNRETNIETFTAVPEVQQAITELAQGYTLHRDLCLVGPSEVERVVLADDFARISTKVLC